MTDEQNVDNTISTEPMTDDLIREYSSNKDIVKFIQNKFKRLSRIGAVNLTKMLLRNQFPIHAEQIMKKYKSFVRHNLNRFDKEYKMKVEEIKSLKRELNGFLLEKGKDVIEYDKELHKDLEIVEEQGQRYFIVDKNTLYDKTRKLVCDEEDVKLKYNFNKPDMKNDIPSNKDTLQRCMIQILGKGVQFEYPLEYVYQCPQCGGEDRRKSYQMASTKDKLKCPNIYSYINANGEPRSTICGLSLSPDREVSSTKDAFYYEISYEDDELNKHSAGTFSFEKYSPGFYECVLFRVKNPKKTEMYQIVDVKPIKSNTIKLPEREKDENYLFSLQKCFDKFIKKQTGMEIFGLYPVKCALILQTLATNIGFKLIMNAQLSGDASTGKSTVLKYYLFLLNNQLNLSTNGLSVSVAGMRGTKINISLMGKDVKVITLGHLGTFKSIHIDEASENKELIKNLKSFLLEDNYSYDKAGSDGTFNRRTAHASISENLDYQHLGQYRGMIRKAYKELATVQIGEAVYKEWNESWDLHLPLFRYKNVYLHKVVKEKRLEYQFKQQWWIDGQDFAAHERFPFWFYLVNERENDVLSEVIKGNVARNTISENLELMKVLKTDDIDIFFKSSDKYKNSDSDKENFYKVDKILKKYGMNVDSRTKIFYYSLVRLSRIINQRMRTEKMDFDLVRWIIEKTNCKLDIVDTSSYEISGPPDLKELEKEEKLIEEETKKVEGEFGLPGGEF